MGFLFRVMLILVVIFMVESRGRLSFDIGLMIVLVDFMRICGIRIVF